jgi:hypothetical protein
MVWSKLNGVLFDLVQNDMMMMIRRRMTTMTLLKVINLQCIPVTELPQVTGPILLSETRQTKFKQ